MRSRSLLLLSLAGSTLCCLGCPGNEGNSEPSPTGTADTEDLRRTDGDGGARGMHHSVAGTVEDTYLTDSGPVNKARDLSGVRVTALLPDDRGGFQKIPGTAAADGTFRIENVPQGIYYLKFDDTYLVTAARDLDLGQVVQGRPDQTSPKLPTPLTFNVRGLSPWTDQDLLELFSSNASAYFNEIGTLGPMETIPNGATELLNYKFDYLKIGKIGFPNNLIQKEKGDTAILWQMATKTTAGGVPYQALTRFGRAEPLTLVDGQPATINVALMEVPQDQSLTAKWKRSAFEVYRAAMTYTMPTLSYSGWSLWAEPGGTAYGQVSGAPDLLFGPVPMGSEDVDAGSLAYGNPYPASWAIIGDAGIFSQVGYTTPDVAGLQQAAELVVSMEKAAFAAAPIEPLVSPVQAPKIAGKDLMAEQRGVGTSPVLTWDPPKVGTPAGYVVTITRLGRDMDGTLLRKVATIYTAGSGVTVPPDVLKAGASYFVRISAVAGPGFRLQDHPFRRGFPEGRADVLTALFSP